MDIIKILILENRLKKRDFRLARRLRQIKKEFIARKKINTHKQIFLWRYNMLHRLINSALLVALLLILIEGNSFAQTQANATVNASATILAALTITKNTDVVFGNVGATTPGPVYLDPKGLAASNYIGTSAAVGTFTIAAASTQSIHLGWPATVQLTAGANHLTYTLKVNGFTASTQASSTTLSLTGGYCDVTTSATGGYFLWVGGDIGTLTTQATGAYTGTANFTVEYN